MLLYNLPIFPDGDPNAFLAGVARANGFMKKVRARRVDRSCVPPLIMIYVALL